MPLNDNHPGSLSLVTSFVKMNHIEKGATVEETVVNVLQKLAEHPFNVAQDRGDYSQFYEELVSSCAVILNGLTKIKDPVRMYGALSKAFARRGYCIFNLRTVQNAIMRVQSDAAKRGHWREIFDVWNSKTSSDFFKAIVSEKLPKEFFSMAMGTPKFFTTHHAPLVIEAFCKSPHLPLEAAKEFLSATPIIAHSAVRGILQRRDLPFNHIHAILSSTDAGVKFSALGILEHKRIHVSKRTLLKLIASKDISQAFKSSLVRHGVKNHLISGRLLERLKNKSEYSLEIANAQVFRHKETTINPLKFNSGSKGARKNKMLALTSRLRK